MAQAVIHVHRGGPLLALVGNPNCGKTALFNRLTGSRQKVANDAGVTVERKEGRMLSVAGKILRLLDLPGTYSLHPRSPDERVTHNVLLGRAVGEKRPDLVVCMVDATNLRRNLRLVLAVQRLGLPCVVVLNRVDLALARTGSAESPALAHSSDGDHVAVQALLQRLGLAEGVPHTFSDRLDRVVLHPVVGPLLLALLLFFMFQAVFAWAVWPMDLIKACIQAVAHTVGEWLPAGHLRSLVVDGVIAGAGGVIVFLPQIVILFAFILVLEESGYLPRAAFLLDRLMGSVGLSGRSFIPLLSCFACAIPGIMATRSISNPRDRLVTIMIAPMKTLLGPVAGVRLVDRRVHPAARLGHGPARRLPAPRPGAVRSVRGRRCGCLGGGMVDQALTVLLWFLASFPAPPAGATGAAIEYSLAGQLGHALAVVFAPIGFNWQISIALVPGHGLVAVGLVRVCAAVSGHSGHGEARNWGLEVAAGDGRLLVRAGAPGSVCHLLGGSGVWGRLVCANGLQVKGQ